MINNWVAYVDGGGQNDPLFMLASTCRAKGLTPTLMGVQYSNIVLYDDTNGIQGAVDGVVG
jgi:hypothetical protein